VARGAGVLTPVDRSTSPADDPHPTPPSGWRRSTSRRRRLAPYAVAGLVYLVVSVVLWWHVWSTHPTATATCGCGDPALFLWFLEWPAYAIAHGHNPFYSTALFHPGGINLLSNTSVLAIGVPLAPVTWLFGPVATLNVASTLAPVLSGLSAFWLLRRWTRWAPAAFVGGLFYGFSPFVISSLVFAHLMTTSLAVLPLILGCLDELLVRQQRRPVPVGIALAALIVVEFFVSTELLLIVAMSAVAGVVLLVAYRAVSDPADLVRRARRAAPGVVVAVGLAVVVLAYPFWFAMAGPAHLSGQIWPGIPVIGGLVPRSFVDAGYASQGGFLLDLGGYFGKALPSAGFVGWGLLGVAVAGLVVWHRDRRLWFFAALAVVTGALSLGVRKHHWVPWQIFGKEPVLVNVIEQRFMAVTTLALAVMLAVVVDRCRHLSLPAFTGGRGPTSHAGHASHASHASHARHAGHADGDPAGRPAAFPAGRHAKHAAAPPLAAVPAAARAVPLLLAVAVAAVALVPIVWVLAPKLPFAVRPVTVPEWYSSEAPTLPPGQVLLAYPAPFSGIQSAMAWQAIAGMGFAQAGGGGPQGVANRAGPEKAGFEVLTSLGFGLTTPPSGTPAQLAAVRQAVRGWGVTMVVIPQQPGVAAMLRGRDPVYAAAFMTAALGVEPTFQAGAWVWSDVDLAHGPLVTPTGTLTSCELAAAHDRRAGPDAVPACVVRAAQRADLGTVAR
jgi:hypothetical protein